MCVCVVCVLFVCLNPVLLGTASKSATKFRAWTPCEKRRGPVRELDPEQSVRVHQSRSRRRGRSRGTERNPPAGPGRSCAAAAETKVHARLCGCVRGAPPGRARMRTRVQMPAPPARGARVGVRSATSQRSASLAHNLDLGALDR